MTLSREEREFVRDMAEQRVMAKTKDKRVSNHSDLKIVIMGISGEFAAAKALGCLFDPWVRRGGDHHRRDLWKGDVTISVKTRHKHLPAHYLYPTGQQPASFLDDYAVIGLWDVPYETLQIMGYASRQDMNRYVTTLPVSGTRSGRSETRQGVPFYRFRPIEPLITILGEVNDEEVHLAQTQGYVRYFRNGGGR